MWLPVQQAWPSSLVKLFDTGRLPEVALLVGTCGRSVASGDVPSQEQRKAVVGGFARPEHPGFDCHSALGHVW